MPTPTPLVRTWCKTCKDYTLHDRKEVTDENLYCKDCETVATDYNLNDVPEEKITAQQERYKKKRERGILGIYEKYILGGIPSLLEPQFPSRTINEDDAGLISLEKQENVKIENARKVYLSEKERFSVLTRNDTCLCGSGLKYKKCCMSKYQ